VSAAATSGSPAGRLRNAYVLEALIMPHLAALHLLLTEPAAGPRRRRRTRRGADIQYQTAEEVICYADPALQTSNGSHAGS